MTLEAALTYLVAVAVPVWLLVEQVISWRQARERDAKSPALLGAPRVERDRVAAPASPLVGLHRKAA
jgi:hypothetical protein